MMTSEVFLDVSRATAAARAAGPVAEHDRHLRELLAARRRRRQVRAASRRIGLHLQPAG